MRVRVLIIGVIALGTGAVALAAAPAGAAAGRYDLAQCIRAALSNSPDLSAVAADLALARARLSGAHAGRYGQSEFNQILGFVNEARGTVLRSPDNKNDVFNGL